MKKHWEEFKPFVEDNVRYDEYCWSMQEDGECDGHLKLQATSLVTQTHIHIHQVFSLFACI